MDEYEKRLEMLKLITSAEHHFNNLTFNIRALASTWLLATFAGIGWILKDLPTPATGMLIKNIDLIPALCICSSVGIFVLWVLDLKIYQQLLNVWFDGRKLYEIDDEFPHIRTSMKALFSSGRATQYIKFYYMATCSAPLLFGIYLLNVSTPNVLFTTLMVIALTTINGVICCSSISKSYHAV